MDALDFIIQNQRDIEPKLTKADLKRIKKHLPPDFNLEEYVLPTRLDVECAPWNGSRRGRNLAPTVYFHNKKIAVWKLLFQYYFGNISKYHKRKPGCTCWTPNHVIYDHSPKKINWYDIQAIRMSQLPETFLSEQFDVSTEYIRRICKGEVFLPEEMPLTFKERDILAGEIPIPDITDCRISPETSIDFIKIKESLQARIRANPNLCRAPPPKVDVSSHKRRLVLSNDPYYLVDILTRAYAEKHGQGRDQMDPSR